MLIYRGIKNSQKLEEGKLAIKSISDWEEKPERDTSQEQFSVWEMN